LCAVRVRVVASCVSCSFRGRLPPSAGCGGGDDARMPGVAAGPGYGGPVAAVSSVSALRRRRLPVGQQVRAAVPVRDHAEPALVISRQADQGLVDAGEVGGPVIGLGQASPNPICLAAEPGTHRHPGSAVPGRSPRESQARGRTPGRPSLRSCRHPASAGCACVLPVTSSHPAERFTDGCRRREPAGAGFQLPVTVGGHWRTMS
jgi:hypothetical protein